MLTGRLSIKNIEKYLVYSLTGMLMVLFIAGLLIGGQESVSSKDMPERDEIVTSARSYLEGNLRSETGKRLDCSGYTRLVYRNLGVRIPTGSAEQFRMYGGFPLEQLKEGDLVFFDIHGKGVSHVGIYLGDEIFIHSPGKNKYVVIDSLTNTYYKKRFISGGKINFEDLKKNTIKH